MLKTLERILIKIALIQCAFLLLAQFIFHHLQYFPELKTITEYEGVVKEKTGESIETIWQNKAGE